MGQSAETLCILTRHFVGNSDPIFLSIIGNFLQFPNLKYSYIVLTNTNCLTLIQMSTREICKKIEQCQQIKIVYIETFRE